MSLSLSWFLVWGGYTFITHKLRLVVSSSTAGLHRLDHIILFVLSLKALVVLSVYIVFARLNKNVRAIRHVFYS